MKIEIETEITDHGSLYVAGDVYIDDVRITSILDSNDKVPNLDDSELEAIEDTLYEKAEEQGLYVYIDAYDMYGVSHGDF